MEDWTQEVPTLALLVFLMAFLVCPRHVPPCRSGCACEACDIRRLKHQIADLRREVEEQDRWD